MRRVQVVMLGVCVLVVATPAGAQVTQGWQFSVDAINILTRGNDVHVGDVFTESQTSVETPTSYRLDYGVEYEPLVTRMDDKFTVLLAGGYRGSRWGFGGRGWRVTTGGELEGRAQSPNRSFTVTPIPGGSRITIVDKATGVRMWDHSSIPVANDEHPSGYSPVSYHAENSFEHLRIDAYAERVWIGSPDLNVVIRFGAAYARVENTRTEGHAEMAVLFDTIGTVSRTFTNQITLDGESDAEMDLFGPSMAIAGETTLKRLQIDWLVNPALMFGTANTSGSWTDTDDIHVVDVAPGGGRQESTEFLYGVIPIEREARAVVPAIDLQVKASVRVAGSVRVGAGLFSSTWFGVPMAPALSVPGNWIDVEGTGWRDQSRDLTFLGYSAFVAVGF